MRSIRSGKGLGDALYLQAVCRHLTRNGERLRAATMYPDVFIPLEDRVECMPFTRDGIDIVAHYSLRRAQPTRQFQDCCISAGIKGEVDLRLDWKPVGLLGGAVVAEAGPRPIVAVGLPRNPMNRTDGWGDELLPDCRVIQRAIDMARASGCFVVQVGAGAPRYQFTGIDWDLANKTTVVDLIDVVHAAHAVIGYVSFLLPLSESLGKPGLFIWSRRGLKARHGNVRLIRPEKIIEKPTARAVWDDCTDEELSAAVQRLTTELPVADRMESMGLADVL